MRHKLIAEKLVHLLESSTLGFGIEENVAKQGDHVEAEEDIEVPKADGAQGIGGELGEDEVDDPLQACQLLLPKRSRGGETS